MIRHIVLMQFPDDVAPETINETFPVLVCGAGLRRFEIVAKVNEENSRPPLR